ncbi:MAG: ROK family protein [Bacteroidales bacterium]|nr:ROK family protein [Bacteroidales bacterium]
MIVLTLDAGGSKFAFSTIKNGKFVGETNTIPSNSHNLDLCLLGMIDGFKQQQKAIGEPIDAISFAFPGPANYREGIIGDTENLKGFRGGVPLKAMLENIFNVPVFINNDGDLYAYGESLAGSLPLINAQLQKAGNKMQYRNVVGMTIGSGFGGGFVHDKTLVRGDNVTACEIWKMSNRLDPERNCEELIAIRSLRRFYAEFANIPFDETPMPREIYYIGIGKAEGNKTAARKAFFRMGECLGDAIANMITIFDGIVVIGGGVSGARELIIPGVEKELKHNFASLSRVTQKVYCLNDEAQLAEFVKPESKTLKVPLSDKTVEYSYMPKCGYVFSSFNTSMMISVGAYHFAKEMLKR